VLTLVLLLQKYFLLVQQYKYWHLRNSCSARTRRKLEVTLTKKKILKIQWSRFVH